MIHNKLSVPRKFRLMKKYVLQMKQCILDIFG